MLRELHVRNLAVLAGASVELGRGLNCLTGETGAGKSMVVDSLNLLAGGRASSELIRTDSETLTVSGVFEPVGDGWLRLLEEAGLVDEGGGTPAELLIRREISRSGRNRIFVNDQPATLRLLADLAPFLLRIHGQRDELELTTPELQRAWLDRSGGPEAEELLRETAQAHATWARLAERLESLTGDERLRAERLDLLRFQAGELEAAQLQAGEEDELRAERDQLRHREAIRHGLGTALDLLLDDEDAAAERLARSRTRLEEIEDWQPEAPAWCAELEELRIRAEELAGELRRRLEDLDSDPGRLDAVEERLARLERLCRKYGRGTAQLLEWLEEIRRDLELLEGDSDDQEALGRQVTAALEVYRRAARKLSEGRQRWGKELVERMAGELPSLGLGQARLEVQLTARRRADSSLLVDGEAVDFGSHGYDQVTFLFAPNPGEKAQALAKVASGGELSRVYLALQLAARGDEDKAAPTLVFDEVDTGIGGAEAEAVGRKLQRLARSGQILAVTHLPQVASFGDSHFKIEKQVEKGRTFTRVERLSSEERVKEIARMLAGQRITETSLRHAGELLEGGRRAAEDEKTAKVESP